MGPYVQGGHYMYGRSLNQPYPAYYNSSWFHRPSPRRDLFSLLEFYDDGSVYVCDNKPADSTAPIVRSAQAANIINIETLAVRSLRIKLYALKEEDDIDLLLELGKAYSVVYLTEGGLKVATGVLKVIDTTIPDTCVRYVGEFNETVSTAWIGLDCSTTGKSDKRKIFIASIRGIEEAVIDDPNYVPPEVDPSGMTDSEKLNTLLENLPKFHNKLDAILTKVADNDEIVPLIKSLDLPEKLDAISVLITDGVDALKNKLNYHHDTALTALNKVIDNTNP